MNALKLAPYAALLLLSLACAGFASADECQEPGPDGVCPVETFELVYSDGLGPLSGCSVRHTCVNDDSKLGPTPVFIVCSPTGAYGGRFLCEAWPQGDMSYSWVLDTGVQAMDEPFGGGPVRDLRCASGGGGRVVSVTVTAPGGASDTGFTQLPCS